jgi:hypothetical protein
MSPSTTSPPPLSDLLQFLLPEDILHTAAPCLQNYIFADGSPVQIATRRVLSIISPIMAAVYPMFQPVLAAAASFLDNSEGFANYAIAIGAVVAIPLLVNSILRTLSWFARATMRLAYYAVLIALAAMVYQRGVLVCARDAMTVMRNAVTYFMLMKNIFLAEYRRYDEQYQRQHTRAGSRYHDGTSR